MCLECGGYAVNCAYCCGTGIDPDSIEFIDESKLESGGES